MKLKKESFIDELVNTSEQSVDKFIEVHNNLCDSISKQSDDDILSLSEPIDTILKNMKENILYTVINKDSMKKIISMIVSDKDAILASRDYKYSFIDKFPKIDWHLFVEYFSRLDKKNQDVSTIDTILNCIPWPISKAAAAYAAAANKSGKKWEGPFQIQAKDITFKMNISFKEQLDGSLQVETKTEQIIASDIKQITVNGSILLFKEGSKQHIEPCSFVLDLSKIGKPSRVLIDKVFTKNNINPDLVDFSFVVDETIIG